MLFRGSGVRISDSEIITAAHVVSDTNEVAVQFEGVTATMATVTGYDSGCDLALLTHRPVSRGVTVPYTFARDIQLPFGSELAMLGYPGRQIRMSPTITFGRLGAVGGGSGLSCLQGQADATLAGGMSGGAVFNASGDLVGIILGEPGDLPGTGRFLIVNEVQRLINQLRGGYKQ